MPGSVRGSAEELRDHKVRNELEEVFPPEKYAWVTPQDRLEPRTFYLYLSGLAIFLLGGSARSSGCFAGWRARSPSPFLPGHSWR